MTTTSFKNITVKNETTHGTPGTYVEVFAPNPNRRAWYFETDPAAAASIVIAVGTEIADAVPISTVAAGSAIGDKYENVIKQGIYAKSTAAGVAFNAYEKNA